MRKSLRTAFIAAILPIVLFPYGGALAVTGELIVADPRAGIALFGFDPVGYFLSGGAEMGSQSIQLRFAGVIWQFQSEANRAAFRAHPDVYVPRFGGYDPIALTRAAPVAGHPTIFAVYQGRLYLFQKPEHRARFLAAPDAVLERAHAYWPLARRSLVH